MGRYGHFGPRGQPVLFILRYVRGSYELRFDLQCFYSLADSCGNNTKFPGIFILEASTLPFPFCPRSRIMISTRGIVAVRLIHRSFYGTFFCCKIFSFFFPTQDEC
jgi:hypothetical protein